MFLELIISLPSLFSLVIVFAVALFFSRLAKKLVFFSPPSIYSALALTIYPFTSVCFSCLLIECYFLVYYFHLRCFVVYHLCPLIILFS